MGFSSRLSSSSVNIYNSNGTITDATRTVQVGTSLVFNYGAAGVNGNITMTSGGYFKNTTANASNYFEYNHNTGTFLATSVTHTRTGFRAERSAVFGEMMTGGGKTYFNCNGYFEWYVNDTGTYAGMLNSSGNWGFGGTAGTAKVTITGSGSTSATSNQVWKNSGGTTMMTFDDAGRLGINSTDFSSVFTVDKMVIRSSNGDVGTHTMAYYELSLSNSANNAYYQRSFTASSIKYGTKNTYHITGSYAIADNQGTGQIDEFFSSMAYFNNRGNATIPLAANYYSSNQVSTGTITTLASFLGQTTQISGGTVTGLYGMLIKTPTNITGGTITNTYGCYIDSNTIGTNNYGYISNGQMSNGFGTNAPSAQALIELVSTTKAFIIMRMTSAQAGAITAADGMMLYVTDTDATFTAVGFWGRENGAWVKL